MEVYYPPFGIAGRMAPSGRISFPKIPGFGNNRSCCQAHWYTVA